MNSSISSLETVPLPSSSKSLKRSVNSSSDIIISCPSLFRRSLTNFLHSALFRAPLPSLSYSAQIYAVISSGVGGAGSSTGADSAGTSSSGGGITLFGGRGSSPLAYLIKSSISSLEMNPLPSSSKSLKSSLNSSSLIFGVSPSLASKSLTNLRHSALLSEPLWSVSYSAQIRALISSAVGGADS